MNNRRTAILHNAPWRVLALGLVLPVALLMGCGGTNVTTVTGKVSFGGKPVTGGTISFAPIAAQGDASPGQPDSATVKEDGTFELKKAVLGKNRITYVAPTLQPPEGTVLKPSESGPVSPFVNLYPKQAEVEVKNGPNTFEIELIGK